MTAPRAAGDLCRIKQQPGETLQKYIQRFNTMRLKIPRVSDEAIISAFSDGVRDVRIKEELAIHEDLCTALEIFNLAAKCARAEEGRLSLMELPEAEADDKKTKAKEAKRKGLAVLAVEPEVKRDCGYNDPPRDNRPYCVFHDVHSHNTNNCQELRAMRGGRVGQRPERDNRGYDHRGGRGGGRWDGRNSRQGWHDQPREDR